MSLDKLCRLMRAANVPGMRRTRAIPRFNLAARGEQASRVTVCVCVKASRSRVVVMHDEEASGCNPCNASRMTKAK
jgi:hypothetical protein